MPRKAKTLTRTQRALGASATNLLKSGTPSRPVKASITAPPPPDPSSARHPHHRADLHTAPAITTIPAPAFPTDPGVAAVDPGFEHEHPTRRAAKTAMRLDAVGLLKERALIEARELRAHLLQPRFTAWTMAKNESEWWRALRTLWHRYRQEEPLLQRYFLTRFEAAQSSGVPDLLILDQPTSTVAWLELKFRKFPYNWPKAALNLGCSPAQAVWLWRWRRHGGRAGVLCGTNAGFWIWVPAHAAPEWPERLLAPNGWMTVPHVVGTGPPPEPAVLWALETDLTTNGGTPSTPRSFTTPDSYATEVAWPSVLVQPTE